jgi:tRNA/tmRNA/rRNA uracil-C5-methylase (TrmA/RlmC/RlmD family)
MPYADPTEQKAYNLELYLRRYAEDPEFRADEAFRKKLWYYRNQEKIVARYRKKRKKIRAAFKAVRSGQPIHAKDAALLPTSQRVPVLF